MSPTPKIFVAGGGKALGSAILRAFEAAGQGAFVGRGAAEPNLRDQMAVDAFFEAERPDWVIYAAGKAGGIGLNRRAPADLICSAMAYPGSKLYDDAVTQGLPLPATWDGFSQCSRDCLPLPTRHLTGGQVLAFRDYSFDAYYKNPRYLDMIRPKFGAETMPHIIEMAEKGLVRGNAVICAPQTQGVGER